MSAPILTAAEREQAVACVLRWLDMERLVEAPEALRRLAASHAALEAEHRQFVEYHETSADEWTAKYDRLRADLAAAEGRVRELEATQLKLVPPPLPHISETTPMYTDEELARFDEPDLPTRLATADATVATLRGALERIREAYSVTLAEAEAMYGDHPPTREASRRIVMDRTNGTINDACSLLATTDPSGLAVIRARIAAGHTGGCAVRNMAGQPMCTCGHDELVARFGPVARGEG